MTPSYRSGTWLSHGWLVTLVSLAAILILTLLLWSPWSYRGIAGGKTLRLDCAAGLSKPVAEIIKEYEKEYGVTVHPSYDGSGKLLSMMRARGGTGDLYLAADAEKIDKARQYGLVDETIPVAVQRPVLIVKRTTQESLEKQGKPITGLADLLRPDLKVVLANPKLASIGQLSEQVLEPLGIWGRLQQGLQDSSARVSTVGTVQEVVQIVLTRDDYLGIVWDANAQSKELEIIPVADFENVSELVQIGVLKKSRDPTAALQFARFLTARDKGGVVFARHGYAPVADADLWAERPRLHLSAGAMLKPALEEVVKVFAEREGVTVNTTYAGCGVLVSQMEALKRGQGTGSFPDAYFACDASFLTPVEGWFEAGTTIARNDMVLIVQRGNPKNVRSLADVARADLRVGLCHPTKSALGKLTDQLLQQLGLHEAVYPPGSPPRVVQADAAHLLVNQLRVGALDLAVVYRNALSTPVNAEKFLDIIEANIPGAIATQPFAIARESRHKYLMRRLRDRLVTPESARRFQEFGFHWAYEATR